MSRKIHRKHGQVKDAAGIESILELHVQWNTKATSLCAKEFQNLLDEHEASGPSRKQAWENLQELRWALKETTGI
ncbi:MAG: hypothetical protein JO232_22840 [Verrucomicrobia bacterium]|nr:hypothetical protein [Verrucomicrobiota bacterium]